MSEENIEETRSLIEEINQNELMIIKHKKNSKVLNYTENLLILISAVARCISISSFASLVGIPIGSTRSAIGLKMCIITVRIETYKPIIKKKKKKHNKILLLEKSKLNSIEALISKALIDSNVSHNEFVLINNVLKKFYDIKEEIKNSNDK